MRPRADIYFTRTAATLRDAHCDPVVVMEVFCRQPGKLFGMEHALGLLELALPKKGKVQVDFRPDGTQLYGEPPFPVMHIRGYYRDFAELETELLGTLASNTGWASAAQRVKLAVQQYLGDRVEIIAMGARHIHPMVSGVMQLAAVAGGVDHVTTEEGAALRRGASAGEGPVGTMPHSLMLCIGDTVTAASMFHGTHEDVPLTVLVDTFKDEVEEAIRVGKALPDLVGVRIDTPSERGGVTPGLVRELRAKLDADKLTHVQIIVSGGMNPEKIAVLAGCPIDAIGVGSFIAHAAPIDFTADIREVDGYPVAKRGRLPGLSLLPDSKQIEFGSMC